MEGRCVKKIEGGGVEKMGDNEGGWVKNWLGVVKKCKRDVHRKSCV